jgi:hypothetical protein
LTSQCLVLLSPLVCSSILFVLWFGLLQGDPGPSLELPNRKTRGFIVQIALPRWFPERIHQLFGEMTLRI